jgi:hypothetical protein
VGFAILLFEYFQIHRIYSRSALFFRKFRPEIMLVLALLRVKVDRAKLEIHSVYIRIRHYLLQIFEKK